jgi:hypothetical protein
MEEKRRILRVENRNEQSSVFGGMITLDLVLTQI